MCIKPCNSLILKGSSHLGNKRYFLGLKLWYGSRKRPSFGYKILKNRRFPSLSDFRQGGRFKGN
nr:MAG TPA: hypothetical protein [Caudoviricetes sp.]